MAYSTKDFVEKYAETTGITKKAAKEALDGFFTTLKQGRGNTMPLFYPLCMAKMPYYKKEKESGKCERYH